MNPFFVTNLQRRHPLTTDDTSKDQTIMMIRRLILTCLLALPAATLFPALNATAAEQFPYQAIVVAEKTEVRCGPGMKFYPTSMAKQNDQVTVHRHDHGGWYMITPPAGSFSWIDAALINPIGGNRGLVTIDPGNGPGNRAIVRIGSTLSDDHSFFGRELSNGDEVVIMGEKLLAGPSGGKRMLKIAPPAQEFRWIKGEFLVPMSRQIQQQIAVDPYQVPAEFRQRQAVVTTLEVPADLPAVSDTPKLAAMESAPEVKSASLKSPDESSGPKLLAPNVDSAPEPAGPPSRSQQDFVRLDEIDQRYQQMVGRDPAEWDLDGICKSYEDLKKNACAHVSQLAAERLELVSRRRDIAQHYKKFVQISSETSLRDAQLLAQKSEVPMEPLAAPSAFQAPVEGLPQEMMASEQPVIQQMSGTMPAPATPEGVTPQLNGAGILQRMQPSFGAPTYVLVAPNGRMLAYVEPSPGVSLEEWVGKPAGLIGRRNREDGHNMDLIRVQRIVPIRLAP